MRGSPGRSERHAELAVLLVISAGGAAGSVLRYAVGRALPHAAGAFPWSTLLVNLGGCLLIGVLMAVLDGARTPRWVRPFLGVGVLGGFTTFSAVVADVQVTIRAGAPATALAYLLATALPALAAVWAGDRLVAAARTARGTGRGWTG